MLNETKNRDIVIDIAKGISIILVVIGHSPVLIRMIPLNNFLTSFRLPFFFFVSGIFFKESKPFTQVFIDKADALLKAYFVTLLLYGIPQVAGREVDAGGYLLGILYGTSSLLPLRWRPMWFLPHLFCVILFAWIFVRFTRIRTRSIYIRVLMLLGLLGAGVLMLHPALSVTLQVRALSFQKAGLPFSLDLAPLTCFYFLNGFLLRDSLLNFSSRRIPLLAAIGLVTAIQYSTGASMDLNLRRYDHLVFSTLNAFGMIYIVLSLAAVCARIPMLQSGLTRVGCRSLFVLIFHFFIMQHTARLLTRASGTVSLPVGAIAILAGVVLPTLFGTWVRKSAWLSLFFLPLKTNPLILKIRSRTDQAATG